MVTSDLFREGMRRLPACVNVITTINDGEPAGCTATAVCSLSDDPPSLVVCLNEQSETGKAVLRAGKFCVNICAPNDLDVSRRFAVSGISSEKFKVGNWEQTPSGLLRLTSAVAAFDCTLSESMKFGTHYVIVGTIKHIVLDGDETNALLYANGDYGAFAGT